MRPAGRLIILLAAAGLYAGVAVQAQEQAQEPAGRRARVMGRQARGRFLAAIGPNGAADLARLRETLEKVADVSPIEVSAHANGAAIRFGGSAAVADLVAAGKTAGYTLRAVAAYVVSGSNAAADLLRLKTSLREAARAEDVEARPLTGGATLLIYGDTQPTELMKAARSVGYVLWPINEGGNARVFRIGGNTDPAAQQKLKAALMSVMGISQVEIRTTPDGTRLALLGDRVRPDAIAAAAASAGVTLTPVAQVMLPSLEPRAGRDTPPDFDEWVMDELTKPGELAPDFSLLSKDGQTSLRLSDFRGKKPVVLMFGSCT